jgi:hypothetical protein
VGQPTEKGETVARDKSAYFIELANKRVNRAFDKLRLVGNLSNRNNYAYTDDQVTKIFGSLRQELKAVEDKFLPKRGRFQL